jgi:hypothetical protein
MRSSSALHSYTHTICSLSCKQTLPWNLTHTICNPSCKQNNLPFYATRRRRLCTERAASHLQCCCRSVQRGTHERRGCPSSDHLLCGAKPCSSRGGEKQLRVCKECVCIVLVHVRVLCVCEICDCIPGNTLAQMSYV